MKEAFAGYAKRTCMLISLALALRVACVLAFPHVGGDSFVYENYARNLLRFGIYSHLQPRDPLPPQPTLIRTPGYPLLMSAVFVVAGVGNETAVRLVQALIDTATCILIALLAFEISSRDLPARRRLAQWALLLATLCPFIANYSASLLAEVPTTFLLTASTLCAIKAFKQPDRKRHWFLCGAFAGGAVMFRPESGLLLVAAGMTLALRECSRGNRRLLVAQTCLAGTGLVLVMTPWTLRNAATLGVFQPLAPLYAQDPDKIVPTGYFNWCKTWLWHYRDIDRFLWTVGERKIPADVLPETAAENEKQREEVLGLFDRHNQIIGFDRESDDRFEAIAHQRRRRHPFQYYLEMPFLRSVSLWFSPRIEVLPLEGYLLPLSSAWENDPYDTSFTLLLFAVNLIYLGLAAWGTGAILRQSRSLDNVEFLGCLLLLVHALIRTAFIAGFTFPEPRYVLEAYPGMIVLGSFTFRRYSSLTTCR